MVEKTVKVINRAGVHARPASLIVSAISKMKSRVTFETATRTIDAKSILGVITLGASYGMEIKITAEGEDEDAALAACVNLFETKFEET